MRRCNAAAMRRRGDATARICNDAAMQRQAADLAGDVDIALLGPADKDRIAYLDQHIVHAVPSGPSRPAPPRIRTSAASQTMRPPTGYATSGADGATLRCIVTPRLTGSDTRLRCRGTTGSGLQWKEGLALGRTGRESLRATVLGKGGSNRVGLRTQERGQFNAMRNEWHLTARCAARPPSPCAQASRFAAVRARPVRTQNPSAAMARRPAARTAR